MKPRELTLEERAIVLDPGERILFEIINGFTELELKYFDVYAPTNLKHYAKMQAHWIETERYLLTKKLQRAPTNEELLNDMDIHHNPGRFRTWYILKFPENVKRIDENDIL